MIKRLLVSMLLCSFSVVYAQNTENGNVVSKNQPPNGKTILNVAAYPNPFNIKSLISYQSTVEQIIYFEVKNVLGTSVYKQKYVSVVGYNEINFLKENLPDGMYIYSIQTNSEVVSKRLVIK